MEAHGQKSQIEGWRAQGYVLYEDEEYLVVAVGNVLTPSMHIYRLRGKMRRLNHPLDTAEMQAVYERVQGDLVAPPGKNVRPRKAPDA